MSSYGTKSEMSNVRWPCDLRRLEVLVGEVDVLAFPYSYALTISSSGTGMPSFLQIFS